MPYAYMAGDNCYGRGDYYRGDYYQGDIFGKFFKGVVGGIKGFITGGPLGAAAGVAKGVGLIPHPGGTALAPVPTPLQLQAPTLQGPAQMGVAAQYGLVNISRQPMRIGPGGGATPAMMPVQTPGGTVMVPCQVKGTHLNKSGYFIHHWAPEYVPKGSVCVRNRRMNVANGHALRRALRRVQGFGRVVKRMKKAVARANSAVGNVHHARKKRIGK